MRSKSDIEPKGDVELAEEEAVTSPRKIGGLSWALVVVALLASIMLYSLDNTITANIVPSIVSDLNDATELPWLSVGFMMGGLCVALPFGKLYGLLDIKFLYLVSVLLFMGGSALCGGAPNMPAMIVGRVLAGIGGNGMNTGVNTLFSMNTTDKELPLYMAFVGMTYGIGTLIGPVVGGAFAGSSATWRWGFYINLVVGGVCTPVYLLFLPRGKLRQDLSLSQRLRTFDFTGAVLQAGCLASLIIALNFGGTLYHWSSARIIVLFVVAFILLVAFAIQQGRPLVTKVETRLFPVHLLLVKEAVCCFILMASSSTGVFMVMYYVPLYFQFARGAGPLRSGVELLPFITTTTFSIMANGFFLSKGTRYKPWCLGGSAIALVGAVLMSRFKLDTPNANIYGFEILLGLGFGCWLVSNYSIIQSVVGPSEMVSAVTFIVFAQMLGLALSLSIAGAVFINTCLNGLKGALPNVPFEQLKLAISGADSTLFTTLEPVVQKLCLDIIIASLQKSFILVYVAAAIGVLCSIFLSHQKIVA